MSMNVLPFIWKMLPSLGTKGHAVSCHSLKQSVVGTLGRAFYSHQLAFSLL